MKGSIEQIKGQESSKPEWMKCAEDNVNNNEGLYLELKKIAELTISEQLPTREELNKFRWSYQGVEIQKEKRMKDLLTGTEILYFEEMVELEDYAEKNGIELNKKLLLQKTFDYWLARGKLGVAVEIEDYAKEKEIELEIKKDMLQKGFDERLMRGEIPDSELIKNYAKESVKEKEVELEVKKDVLQKGIELVCEYRHHEIDGMESYAKKNGIELDMKKALQKGLEAFLAGGCFDDRDLEEIKSCAKEKGIELTFSKEVKDITEESYIRLVHNPDEGHAEHRRDRLIGKAKGKGIELDYNKVVKMDYLDFLEIPEEERFVQQKEVKLGDATLDSKFYGQLKENEPIIGKFIIGINPKTKETQFIFDATMGEHKDIGAKYDVEVVGGGWLEIDKENKKITIKKKSQDFGYEPRIISTAVIVENFPDYEINVEN